MLIVPGDFGSKLPSTIWADVELAAFPSTNEGFKALERLLTRYRGALLTHLIIKFGFSVPDAEDHLHNFIEEKILRRNCIARARKEKGKFRTFLLAALDRFVISELRRLSALKRSIDRNAIPLHELPESQLPIAPEMNPDEPMLVWCQAAHAGAILDMYNSLMAASRKLHWDIFLRCFINPGLLGVEKPRYSEIKEEYKLPDPTNVFNLVVTVKRMFYRHLGQVLSEYLSQPEEVGEEYEELKAMVIRLKQKRSR